MFPRRYFPGVYFAPVYFPQSQGSGPVTTGTAHQAGFMVNLGRGLARS